MSILTIDALSEKTSDAYSFDRYSSWTALVKKLRSSGYNDLEVEAILRSKITRWAADSADKPYGKATGVDLMNYLNKSETKESIQKLVKETFATA